MNQRAEFVMRAFNAENFRALCGEYGVSAKTGYKWMERFRQGGLGSLADQSRRPRGHARELCEEVICEMVRLKKLRPAWGPKKIRAIYARTHTVVPSESSFKPVLERAGWVGHRPKRRREAYSGTPEDLDYGLMNQRKVRPQGIIPWRQDWIFISSALAGWSVGLEAARRANGRFWFGRLLLGELDEAAWMFIPRGKEN